LSRSQLSEHFDHPPRIKRRRAFLIVVEEDEYGAPLPLPFRDLARPAKQRLVGVMIFVPTRGAMAANVYVACRHLPRRRRIVMIGKAERYIVLAQKIDDVVLVPARVAEFEGIVVAAAAASAKTTPGGRDSWKTAAAIETAPRPPWATVP
jgi:hypothetical protein